MERDGGHGNAERILYGSRGADVVGHGHGFGRGTERHRNGNFHADSSDAHYLEGRKQRWQQRANTARTLLHHGHGDRLRSNVGRIVIWTSTTAPFEEMLMTDAFSNFRQILNEVTLPPAMGQFLDIANNEKANAAATTLPNENYAREAMQLFTIGIAMLNIDARSNSMATAMRSRHTTRRRLRTSRRRSRAGPTLHERRSLMGNVHQ